MMNSITLSGKDWEVIGGNGEVYCYILDLGDGKRLIIINDSHISGGYSLYYICNDVLWQVKKESDLYECIEAGNDIADGKIDDNVIMDHFYDQILKKKEETKNYKDADVYIDVGALKKSIKANGHASKSIIAMEELAELSQVVSKAYRYIDNNETKMESGLNTADILDNMAEEIADALICIANLKIMYGIKNEDINGWIDYKIRRQKIKDTKMKSK